MLSYLKDTSFTKAVGNQNINKNFNEISRNSSEKSVELSKENVEVKHFNKEHLDNSNEIVSYRKLKISKRGFKEFYNYQIENNLDFNPASKIPNDFSVNEAMFSKWFQDNVIIGKHGGVYVDTKYVYRINTNSAEKTASIDEAFKIQDYQEMLEGKRNDKSKSKRTNETSRQAIGLRRNNSVYGLRIEPQISEETTRNTRISEDSQNTRGSREGTLQEGTSQERVNSNSNKNTKSKSSSSTNSNNQKIEDTIKGTDTSIDNIRKLKSTDSANAYKNYADISQDKVYNKSDVEKFVNGIIETSQTEMNEIFKREISHTDESGKEFINAPTISLKTSKTELKTDLFTKINNKAQWDRLEVAKYLIEKLGSNILIGKDTLVDFMNASDSKSFEKTIIMTKV